MSEILDKLNAMIDGGGGMIEIPILGQMTDEGIPVTTRRLLGEVREVGEILVWAEAFPEHPHFLHYDRAVCVHDRDVEFYRGDVVVAYAAPLVEWDEPNMEVLAAWGQQWAELRKNATPEQMADVDDFMNHA